MRGYIIICLVAAAVAAPQYNYEQSGSGLSSAASFGPAAPAIYNKQISIWGAPEDALDEGSSPIGSIANQRSLRVVLIKAPENRGLENAALQLAKSAGDQQTAIYVLNKQTDLGDLERKLSQISNPNANKPEVHFVKYKTAAEAEHAQHTIQNQYNSLAGPTSVSNEGPAPVQSFIGSAGGIGGIGGIGGLGSASTNRGSAAYLPPLFRRF